VRARPLYVDLLYAALSARGQSEKTPPSGEALSRLVWQQHEVIGNRWAASDRNGAVPALASQIAYDAALILYARSLGIDCDPDRFGPPEDERQRIERVLAARGIPLE
jgi:hypothetical protein